MQEHAEELHSIPKVRCPVCQEAIDESETVCPNCGAKLPRPGGHATRDRR